MGSDKKGEEKKPRERGRKGSLPGDGGRRWRKGRKRGGGGVWRGDVFQVQRVSGHDAAAIPPTVLCPGFLWGRRRRVLLVLLDDFCWTEVVFSNRQPSSVSLQFSHCSQGVWCRWLTNSCVTVSHPIRRPVSLRHLDVLFQMQFDFGFIFSGLRMRKKSGCNFTVLRIVVLSYY